MQVELMNSQPNTSLCGMVEPAHTFQTTKGNSEPTGTLGLNDPARQRVSFVEDSAMKGHRLAAGSRKLPGVNTAHTTKKTPASTVPVTAGMKKLFCKRSSSDEKVSPDETDWLCSVLFDDDFEFLPRKQGFLKKRSSRRRLNRRYFTVNNNFLVYFKRRREFKRSQSMTQLRQKQKRDPLEASNKPPHSASHRLTEYQPSSNVASTSMKPKLAFLNLMDVSSIALRSKNNRLSSTIILTLRSENSLPVDASSNTLMLKARSNAEAWQWIEVLNKRMAYFSTTEGKAKIYPGPSTSSASPSKASEPMPATSPTSPSNKFYSIEHYQLQNILDNIDPTDLSSESAPSTNMMDSDDGYFTGEEEEGQQNGAVSSARGKKVMIKDITPAVASELERAPMDYDLSCKLFIDLFDTYDPQHWEEGEANKFVVRDRHYLTDGKKCSPPESLFRLLCMDIFKTKGRVDHIMSVGQNRHKQFEQRYGKKYVEICVSDSGTIKRRLGLPFLFTVHIQIPGPPFYSIVSYWTAKDHRTTKAMLEKPSMGINDPSLPSNFPTLFRKFMSCDDDGFRNERYKLIPQIIDAPYIVRAAVPTKPALLGKKITQRYFRNPSAGKGYDGNYMEVCLDIGSSIIAHKVVQIAANYSRFLDVELGIVLEGREVEELPERILCAYKIRFMDFRKALEVAW